MRREGCRGSRERTSHDDPGIRIGVGQPSLAVHALGWRSGAAVVSTKKQSRETRCWLRLSASVKFAIPFSLLVALGSHLGFSPVTPAELPYQPRLLVVIRTVLLPAPSPLPFQP